MGGNGDAGMLAHKESGAVHCSTWQEAPFGLGSAAEWQGELPGEGDRVAVRRRPWSQSMLGHESVDGVGSGGGF